MEVKMKITQKQADKFLNWLRKSGQTNMFVAIPFLQKQFNIDGDEAKKLLINWMENFGKDDENEKNL
tara:strand:+ start:782 stop:982 length:201 start_codon:yes stop_codon:yes gene_type:complete